MNGAGILKKYINNHLGILVIIVLQIIVVIPSLVAPPLWLDEAYSALMARLSMPEIHTRMAYDAGPPLYYDLLHNWRFVFGESEAALRSFSLFAAIVGTLFLYRLADEFFNRRTAILSCLFWAFSPLAIHYMHEVRNYTLFAALMLGYVWFLLRYIQYNKRMNLDFSVIFLILLVYTHNLGWFAALSGLVTIFIFGQGWKLKVYKLTAIGVVFIAYLPWLPILFQQVQNTEMTIDWVKRFWHPGAILMTCSAFLPGGNMPVYISLPQLPPFLQWLTLFVWCVPLFTVLGSLIRYRSRVISSVFVLAFASLLFPYLYSLLAAPVYLPARTDFFVFPLFCLLLAYGINLIPWTPLQYGYIFIYLMAACTMIIQNYSNEPAFTEKDMVRYLRRHIEENDIILCTGLTRPVVEYYLANNPTAFRSFPKDMEKHLAHFNEGYYLNTKTQDELETEVLKTIEDLQAGNTLWILYSRRQINQAIDNAIQQAQQEYIVRVSPPIETQRMGLQRLNEPASIIPVKKERNPE